MNAVPHNLFGDAEPLKPDTRLKRLPSSGFMAAAKVPPAAAPPPKAGPRKVVNVDSFAGCGGASDGVELALRTLEDLQLLPAGHGAKVTYAINHDEPAIVMHTINHPETIHLQHNVWKVNMKDLLADNFFGILWLSPDCRDHSSAKGGPITSRSVRDLAWVLVRWLRELPAWQRPWMISLENVGAFADWGPLIARRDGKPGYERDPDRIGELFHLFVKTVCGYGYSAGWKKQKSCSFGDPTIRNRLYVVFRRDGQKVEWMEPTHGDPKSPEVAAGELEPWPVAADILDFSLPCPSILMTKAEAKEYTKRTGIRIIRPLAWNSDARIAKGVKRYVLDAEEAERFVVTCNHSGEEFRGQGTSETFRTVTRARDAHGLVVPHMLSFHGNQLGGSALAPVGTLTANSFIKRPGGALPIGMVETAFVPFMAQHNGDRKPSGAEFTRAGRSMKHPVGAVTTSCQQSVVAAHLMTMRNSAKPFSGPLEPTHTVTAGGAGLSLVDTLLAPFMSRGQHGGGNRAADWPHSTVAASDGDQNQVVVPYLVPRYGERDGQEPRTRGVDVPMPTPVPTGNGGSLAAVYLAQHNTDMVGHSAREAISTIVQKGWTQGLVSATFIKREFGNSIGAPTLAPVGAITAGGGGKTQLMAAHMLSLKGSARRDRPCTDPHYAICASGQHSAVVTLPLMTAYYSNAAGDGSQATSIDYPMPAATTKDRFGLTQADAAPAPLTEEQWASARKVAEFLRRHGCWDGGEVVTVVIRGETYVIVDIGMRMLIPRELARANGFPDSFILAVPYKGGVLSETEQRHKIGNSVCRRPAAAAIIPNYRPPPEWAVNDNDERREAA